jgi:hypothetical protein
VRLTERGLQILDLVLEPLHLRARTRAAAIGKALLAALEELPPPVPHRLLRHLRTPSSLPTVISPETTERTSLNLSSTEITAGRAIDQLLQLRSPN